MTEHSLRMKTESNWNQQKQVDTTFKKKQIPFLDYCIAANMKQSEVRSEVIASQMGIG